MSQAAESPLARLLRRHVVWRVVRSFGITSALGGLTGALVQAGATNRALEVVFGVSVASAASQADAVRDAG